MQARNEIRSTARFAAWTLAWAATLALAKFGPGHLWDSPQRAASWIAVAVNLAVGLGWIIAFIRYLREIDELERKIMQEALAITLGVGWVVAFAYVVADAAGLVTRNVNVAILPVLMGVVFVAAVFAGRVRHR